MSDPVTGNDFFFGGGGVVPLVSCGFFGVLLQPPPACLPLIASSLPLPACVPRSLPVFHCYCLYPFAIAPFRVSLKTQDTKKEGFIPAISIFNRNIVGTYRSLKPFIHRGLTYLAKKNYLFIWWNEVINYICERINQLIIKK